MNNTEDTHNDDLLIKDLYSKSRNQEPSSELDHSILQAAQQHVEKQKANSWWDKKIMYLSTAAVILLSAGIVFNMLGLIPGRVDITNSYYSRADNSSSIAFTQVTMEKREALESLSPAPVMPSLVARDAIDTGILPKKRKLAEAFISSSFLWDGFYVELVANGQCTYSVTIRVNANQGYSAEMMLEDKSSDDVFCNKASTLTKRGSLKSINDFSWLSLVSEQLSTLNLNDANVVNEVNADKKYSLIVSGGSIYFKSQRVELSLDRSEIKL